MDAMEFIIDKVKRTETFETIKYVLKMDVAIIAMIKLKPIDRQSCANTSS